MSATASTPSDAADDLMAFAEKIDCPVTTTLLGRGAFPGGHALALDMLGMHGTAYANWAIHEADLIIALGARFDDRVTGNPEKWAPNAKVIHVDIDHAELGKIRFAQGADSGRRENRHQAIDAKPCAPKNTRRGSNASPNGNKKRR